jgi:hypothetical protein
VKLRAIEATLCMLLLGSSNTHALVLCARQMHGRYSATVRVREACNVHEVELTPMQPGAPTTTIPAGSTSTTTTPPNAPCSCTVTTTTLPNTRCCIAGTANASVCVDVPNTEAGIAYCTSLPSPYPDPWQLAFAGYYCGGNGCQLPPREGPTQCCQLSSPDRCFEGIMQSADCVGVGGTFLIGMHCLPSGQCGAP